ncbi:MAG: MFS transporter [Candidatus Dormibacteria bacterium]
MSGSTTSTPRSPSPPLADLAPHRRLLLGVVAAGLVLAALDTYVVVTLLPRMMNDIGVSLDRPEQASPVISGFLLGYIVALPVLGAVSDAYGRGRVYLACLVLFALGSLVTATAGLAGSVDNPGPNLWWLVAGRVVQGLGGGALVPVAMALAADLYPSGARAQALGVVAGLQETGSLVGPLYGALLAGALGSLGGWRAVFWVNLPLVALCVAGLVVAGRRAPAVLAPPVAGERSRVDWLGGALLALGLGMGLVALYPDDPSRHAVGPLFVPLGVGALLALAMFLWRQARRPGSLIPAALMRDPIFLGAALTNLLVGVGLMVALVDIPVFAQGVFRLDELRAALLLAQFMLAIPFGAVAGGWLASRAGYRLTAAGGLVLAAAAFFEMSAWDAAEIGRRVFGLPPTTITLLLLGLGFGVVIAPVAAAILDRSGRREHGLASSLVVLARTVGMLLGLSGLAAFGIRRFNQLAAHGPAVPINGGASVIEAAIKARVAAALVQEYHEVFTIAAAICLAAAAIAAVSLARPRDLAAVPLTVSA